MASELDDLPARIRAGDAGAFRQLVDSLAPRLVRVAARLVGDVHLAEDWSTFEGRARVETWLYRIVTNRAIDVRRGRLRRPLAEQHSPEPIAPEQLECHLALRELATWLDDLPDAQRTALVLSALEGMSQREVAEIQACTEGAVEQRLVRARQALRMKGGRGRKGMSDHDQEIEDKLERLREATANLGATTGFAARVVAGAATMRPASRWRQLARAWWTVPIAAAMAAGALFWAVRVRADVERTEAAREIDAALSFPAGASVW